MKHKDITCARDGFGVSSMTGDGPGAVAHPTRHWPGHLKFGKCDLYGQRFHDSDAAHAAMHARGYSETYWRRDSTPIACYVNHAAHKASRRFDALYRFLKREAKRNPEREHASARRELRQLAEVAGIFHSCAKVVLAKSAP